MGPRAGLDAVDKRKFLTQPGIERRPSSPQPPSILTERFLICACTRIVSYMELTVQFRVHFNFILCKNVMNSSMSLSILIMSLKES
jgi:hypothetical protein